MKPAILTLTVLLLTAVRAAAFETEYYAHGNGGYGLYYLEGEETSSPAFGLYGGIQASKQMSFEAAFQYDEVGSDQYYFAMLGAKYSFTQLDFFMEPSLDFRTGILIPVGDKEDVDGVVGLGAGLLYKTHYNIEFGPRVDSILVLAGPNRGLMLNFTAAIGYRFK